MIVEDDDDMLKLLTETLSTVALVKRAVDGKEAFDYMQASSSPPDLVITDVIMPRMTGLELTKNMKNDRRLKNVPVIMLTAKSSPLDHVTGINAGARHYLTKPINQVELLNKVISTLGIKR